jgi:hypothetical protein
MKKVILNVLKYTGAYDNASQKAKFLHPIGFIFFFLLLPIAVIGCIFVDEDIVSAIKQNYKLF